MGRFGWANEFELILPLLEESERHGWSNPRWIMVISHGKFSLFWVNYGVHELAIYSVISIFLKKFSCV